MDRTSSRISKLEAKIEETQQDLEESINAKMEKDLKNVFKNCDEFEATFHDAVKSLLY